MIWTREKLAESVQMKYAESVTVDGRSLSELHTLALRAIDTEADARLGMAVREWCNGFDPECGTHADCMDRIAAECPGTSDAYFALRAIAAALRAEVDR